ncbi:MAG: putative amino-acid metabolite efflux pump [Hyphomicrobiales bacterium]|nr:putative amino-acid metabolite efflux pump [Hyphomicrobiales bacterium]
MNKRGVENSTWRSKLIPTAFVLLWSTGWIVARYAAIDAGVLTFLLFRYAGAALILSLFALASGAAWPATTRACGHALASGVLIHAIYLGGIWWAVAHGVPASISALLAALQPILTAILAPHLAGERIGPLQWAGISLGLVGLLLVLGPKLASVAPVDLASVSTLLAINALGMVSLTLGTFYQKRHLRTGDLRSVAALQFVGAFVVTLPFAVYLEDLRIDFTLNTWLSLAWSVLALSIVSIALLLHLIRRGEVARSAQLIYLVPPAAAIQAFLLFGETLGPIQIAGMVVTTFGVALAVRRQA